MPDTPPDLDLQQLIGEFQRSGLRELHVRKDGIEIYLSQDADAPGLEAPLAKVSGRASESEGGASSASATEKKQDMPVAAAPADLPRGAVIVPAPYLGTFYRSPKPGQLPYVEIGQRVDGETELCLVEVMKLFTAVRAGTAGIVHAVLASDGEMVAADQPLFVIVPA